MWDSWIKPLRRNGLPTTFVIDQEGKIAWIEVNLDHLSWVLDQVLAMKWAREKAAPMMQQKDALEDMLFKSALSKARNPVSGSETTAREGAAGGLRHSVQQPQRGSHSSKRLPSGSLAQPNRP